MAQSDDLYTKSDDFLNRLNEITGLDPTKRWDEADALMGAGRAVDSITGAPVRGAVAAAQKGDSISKGFTDNFAHDSSKAPSGHDIIENLPEGFRRGMTGTGDDLDPAVKHVLGLGVDVASQAAMPAALGGAAKLARTKAVANLLGDQAGELKLLKARYPSVYRRLNGVDPVELAPKDYYRELKSNGLMDQRRLIQAGSEAIKDHYGSNDLPDLIDKLRGAHNVPESGLQVELPKSAGQYIARTNSVSSAGVFDPETNSVILHPEYQNPAVVAHEFEHFNDMVNKGAKPSKPVAYASDVDMNDTALRVKDYFSQHPELLEKNPEIKALLMGLDRTKEKWGKLMSADGQAQDMLRALDRHIRRAAVDDPEALMRYEHLGHHEDFPYFEADYPLKLIAESNLKEGHPVHPDILKRYPSLQQLINESSSRTLPAEAMPQAAMEKQALELPEASPDLATDRESLDNANKLAQLREIIKGQTPIDRPVVPGTNLGTKSFDESKYPSSVKVRAKFPEKDMSHLEPIPADLVDALTNNNAVDELKGLNPGHAEFLARQNFPDADLYRLHSDLPTEDINDLFKKLAELKRKYPKSASPVQDAAAAELPMDEASRIARAKEMGFDTDKTYFHGTPLGEKNFEEFKPSRMGMFGKGVYATDDPEIASKYASMNNSGQTGPEAVMPIHVRGQMFNRRNPADLEKLLADYGVKDWDELSDRFKIYTIDDAVRNSKSFSGIYDPGDKTAVVFDPTNIRSKFAKFDPKKAGSGAISAGLGGAALLGDEDDSPENRYSSIRSLLNRTRPNK